MGSDATVEYVDNTISSPNEYWYAVAAENSGGDADRATDGGDATGRVPRWPHSTPLPHRYPRDCRYSVNTGDTEITPLLAFLPDNQRTMRAMDNTGYRVWRWARRPSNGINVTARSKTAWTVRISVSSTTAEYTDCGLRHRRMGHAGNHPNTGTKSRRFCAVSTGDLASVAPKLPAFGRRYTSGDTRDRLRTPEGRPGEVTKASLQASG